MGWLGGFGNLARTAGGIGNEVQSAQTGLQDLNQKIVETKVKNLMDQLKIQQTQQQIKKGETDPLEQQFASVEKILGRPLNDQEKLSFLNLLQPQQKLPDTPFAAWRTQNPDAPISDWLKLEESSKPQPKPAVPDIKSVGGFDWQYDPENKLDGERGGPNKQWVKFGPTKAPASNIPKYSSVFTVDDPKSIHYGKRFGINSLTGQIEEIKMPGDVNAAKPSTASTKVPVGAAAAMSNYMKATRNLQLAQYITQSGNLDVNSSVTLAKLVAESAPKSDKFLGFFGGNPRSFTPDEANKSVAQLQSAADTAKAQVISIFKQAGQPIPAQLTTKPEDLPGVRPLGQ